MALWRRWPIQGAELLVAAFVVVVLLTGCASDQPLIRTSDQGVGVDVSSGLTRFEPAARKTSPVATGPSLDGTATVSTADYVGKVVVLNVWESACGPCRAEAPDLLRASHATTGTAVFIGLNARDRQTSAAQAFIRSQTIDYPQISDPSGQQLLNFAGTLPLSSIPTTVVIDPEGRIAARIIGTVSATTLTQLITDIAAGR